MLTKSHKVGVYTIAFPVNKGEYAETYRVKDERGQACFLKLINYSKLHRTQYDENGNVLELEIVKMINHPHITSFRDSGEWLFEGKKYAYVVFDFISGETVSQRIAREQMCSVANAKEIISGVLKGVAYLHQLASPVIHNELTIQNIMLDLSTSKSIPKIIDFGYARFLNQGQKSFRKDGLNPFYMAPESFNGVFTPQTDLYSVGAMLYHLLFGLPPYFIDISKYRSDKDEVEALIIREKQKPVKILDTELFEFDEQLSNCISKSLAYDADDRFQSAEEFLRSLSGEIKIAPIVKERTDIKREDPMTQRRKGNGFKDVAGMNALKEQLQSDVIDLLHHPEDAKALGLSLPNGLLFYGPPGCGKTYFAEKFAEEIGCNYQYIKCSDIASPYIHGGQGKIAAVFDEARKNAPTLLFFDEIDAMIKDRSKHTNVSESGEVNEFLTQLNNCGEDGVIVIGATNKPTDIDQAATRAGRLEFKYYIPQPDFETRKMLFEIHLSNRKTDFGIDFTRLAEITNNYISADIKFVVDTAARFAFQRKFGKVTMAILEESIQRTKPSISIDVIRAHEAIRDEFEGNKPKVERKRIGF